MMPLINLFSNNLSRIIRSQICPQNPQSQHQVIVLQEYNPKVQHTMYLEEQEVSNRSYRK